MEIVKAFNSNNLHTEIVIKGTFEEPLFRANDIGEILEMGNIRTSISTFDNTEKVVHSMDTLGGSQQVTFLTEKGLYKILFKSRKPIAEKFQNWICEVVKEIRLNGKYELEKEITKKNLEITEKNKLNDKLIKEKSLERQNILLKEFDSSGSLVYIIKVKTYENGTYIIKIGESRIGITNRFNEHKLKYEECILLDCFSVKKSKDFETFLHNHEKIKLNKVTDLKNHEKERELFLIGNDLTYVTLQNIINANIKNFNEYNDDDYKKFKIENDTLKEVIYKLSKNKIATGENIENNMKSSDNLFIKELIELNKKLFDKIDNLEKSNKEILEKINSIQIKNITTTNFGEVNKTVGQRLQKINPETLTLVKTYDCIAEALKENPKLKRSSINKAICENIIYHGFRWLSIDRELDPTKEIKTKIQNLGYIAKLNKEKIEILNVYIDRKTACKFNDYKSISALDNHVKNKTETNGNYYILYNDCDKELKNNFVKKYGKEPLLYKNGIGQYDLKNNLLQEFCSKQQCCQSVGIGDKSLSKALENKIYYNDYFYKYLDDKIKCL